MRKKLIVEGKNYFPYVVILDKIWNKLFDPKNHYDMITQYIKIPIIIIN